MGVLQLERIKSPFNEIDPTRDCIVALSQLQEAANTTVLKLGQNTDHVRVKINRSPVCANESQSESDCFALLERTQNLSTGLMSNNEHLAGHGVNLAVAPNAPLDVHANAHLLYFLKRTNQDALFLHRFDSLRHDRRLSYQQDSRCTARICKRER